MRLRFIVEGRTEANFVRRVLSLHLSEFGVFAANPQMVATRLAGRGGVKFSGGLIYDKANAGVAIAARIGIETLRSKCRHFAAWISGLESLGGLA